MNTKSNYIIMNRTMIYWLPLILFWCIWIFLLGYQNVFSIFQSYWQSSVTMIAGSFVAGATPLGGGAVAFPVFTKLLGVSSFDASSFSLLIQSVGMTFAMLYLISKNTYINWKLIRLACIGSFISLPFSLSYISLDSLTARFVFSEFMVFCAFILMWGNSLKLNDIRIFSVCFPVITGFVGGLLTAKIGSGCDVVLFFYMVFLCRHCVKESIPTVISFMAVNSLYACFWLLLTTSPTEFVVGSWWASAPVVSLGAPIGAFVLSQLNKTHTVLMVVSVICIEVATSLLFSGFSSIQIFILIMTIALLLFYTFLGHSIISDKVFYEASSDKTDVDYILVKSDVSKTV